MTSIPFIVPADGGEGFRVTPEAVEALGKIKVPVAPIAVVGKYRTGKSFLLNKLIGGKGCFEVGPTIEACTKGIWLWSEPLYLVQEDGTQVAVLFIDTEGIGAAGATAEHDARIFSLATLLCSLLVYNSVGAIDEEAIQSLSFIANLTKHIQLRTGGGDAEFATVKAAYLEELASDDEEEEAGGAGSGGGGTGKRHTKGRSGKGKKQGSTGATGGGAGAASKPAAVASAAAAAAPAAAPAGGDDDDEWGLGLAPTPAKPSGAGRGAAFDSDDDEAVPRAAAAAASSPSPTGGAAGKAPPASNRSGGLLSWFTGGTKSGSDGSKAPAHGGTPSASGKGAASPAARPPAAYHDSDDDDDAHAAASRSAARSGHAHTATGSDDDAAAADSDVDADDDDDEEDDAYGAALGSTKSGGSGGYIASLKAQQRAKRAAAKRQLAARLRDEARRSAGVRRAAALDGDKGALSRTADEAEASTFFPTFLWVLRDFTLDLVADDGFTSITPHEYLDECLAQTASGFSTEAQARNRTRRVLTSFFKDRDCSTLVRPVDDEGKLQLIDSLTDDELRPEFRRQMAELRERITSELVHPKTMQGQFVTGRILAGLAQAYVGAINAHAVPSIGNAWDGVTRVECKDALETAFALYAQRMAAEAPQASLPFDDEALTLIHEKARIASIEEYERKAVGPAAERYRQQLKERVAAEWRLQSAANAAASEASCSRLISSLWHTIIEPKLLLTHVDGPATVQGSPSTSVASSAASGAAAEPAAGAAAGHELWPVYGDHEMFATDLVSVREAYYAQARGPAVHRAFSAFVCDAMPMALRAINAARAAEAERRTAALNQRLAALDHDLEVASARVNVFETQCEDLRKDRQDSAVAKARAEQEAKIAKEELVRAQERVAEIEAERDAVQEKLKQERLAHAQTRVALKAAGGALADGAVAATPGQAATPITPRPASVRPATATTATLVPVDMRAITGMDSDVVRDEDGNDIVSTAELARVEAEMRAQMRMRPKVQEIVDFPTPPQGGACGGGCVVQ